MSNLVFCLMGPTACGKTGLACDLVARYPFDIISVDSALIYKEMDIGTAKPSAEELNRAPHHLINIKEPTQSYSAAEFCTDALALCDAILKNGRIPLLVGGTMMYFNALQKGLSVLPEADEAVRHRIEVEAQQYGWDYLHQQLTRIDPKAALRIHAHDTQRIQRALEVYYLTGKNLSGFLEAQKTKPPYRFINLALFPEQRSWLHERIATRLDQMIAEGFIDEVRALNNKWQLKDHMPSMRCVGYRQVLEYLNGDYDKALLRDKALAATRQLAKRQLTWLRHWDDALFYDPMSATFSAEIIATIGEILDNEPS